MSFKEFWPWYEFERFVVFSTIRLKAVVNMFIRAFIEDFTFIVNFVVVENF